MILRKGGRGRGGLVTLHNRMDGKATDAGWLAGRVGGWVGEWRGPGYSSAGLLPIVTGEGEGEESREGKRDEEVGIRRGMGEREGNREVMKKGNEKREGAVGRG